ncbi:MAG TPA: fibronectin type III domain-containing protein [Candidatus Paceibacterota bacterium]|nr:fibronectin type III domain-containing protein [Candidatus Paceibacterota bacterium]
MNKKIFPFRSIPNTIKLVFLMIFIMGAYFISISQAEASASGRIEHFFQPLSGVLQQNFTAILWATKTEYSPNENMTLRVSFVGDDYSGGCVTQLGVTNINGQSYSFNTSSINSPFCRNFAMPYIYEVMLPSAAPSAPGSFTVSGFYGTVEGYHVKGPIGSIPLTVVAPPPAIPTNLSATPGACGTGQISLSWNPVSGATSYTVRDGATEIATNITGTSFNHTGLQPGSSHSYSVRANNSAGSSAYSNSVQVNAPATCVNTISATAPICNSSGQNSKSNISWNSSSNFTIRIGHPTTGSPFASGNGQGSQWTTDTGSQSGVGWLQPGDTLIFYLVPTDGSPNQSVSVTGLSNCNQSAIYTCTGTNPGNATMCPLDDTNLTANTPKSLVASCSVPDGSAPKCQFVCNSGYVLSGGICTSSGTPPPSTAQLLICPSSATIGVGATTNLEARYWSSIANPTCATGGYTTVTNASSWSSGNSGVATVSNSGTRGIVTGIAIGSTNVTTNYSGLSANSAITVTAGTPPSPSASINAPNCTIISGQSSCNTSVSWNTTGIPTPSIRQNNIQFSTTPSHLGFSRTLTRGTHIFTVYDGATLMANDSAVAECANGVTWNGSICPGTPPPAPAVTLSASPTSIPAGNSSTLTWTVTGTADSCFASNSNGYTDWSGWKSYLDTNQQVVNPLVTTTYSITCYHQGVSSPVAAATVTVSATPPSPAQLIICPATSPIPLAVNGTTPLSARYATSGNPPLTCGSNSFDFLVVTTAAVWSTPKDTIATVDNNPSWGRVTGIATGTETVTARYDGLSATKQIQVGGSGGPYTPLITIVSNPSIVRSGQTAPVRVTITANYDLHCTLQGAVSGSFSHTPSPNPQIYNYTSVALTAARVAQVTCTDPDGGSHLASTTISVIPTFQEI